MPRELITMACDQCKRRNYAGDKNKRKHPDRVTFKKFCRHCGRHTDHKETR